MSQNAHLSTPDPEFVAALETLPEKRLPRFIPEDVLLHGAPLDWKGLRDGLWSRLEGVLATAPNQVSASALKTISLTIPTNNGSEIFAEAYIPVPNPDLGEQPDHRFPLVFWLHGGGFIIGDRRADRLTLQPLAVGCRVSIISSGYRLAPEFPFPTPVNDAYTALKWAGDNAADTLHADLSKGFIVGGMSAGANLTGAITPLARDDPEFKYKITGQLYHIPCFMGVHTESIPDHLKEDLFSRVQNVDDQILTPEYTNFVMTNYNADPTDPRACPLLLPSFKNLPPAYIQVAGGDLIRDEAYVYQRYLKEAGVSCKIEVYPGVPHGWFLILPQLTCSRKFHADTYVGLKWLLDGAQ